MARSLAETKLAKAAYSRRYRKSSSGRAKTKAYSSRTIDERSSRNKARAKMVAKYGKARLKGHDVHHVNSNPKVNKMSNLRIAKAHHEGGVSGNSNAKGKHRMTKSRKKKS